MLFAVAGAKSGFGDRALQLLVPATLRQGRGFYANDLRMRVLQQIIDMPAQFLGIGQMPPQAGVKIPFGAAGVHIISCAKIAASQCTCHNPDIFVDADNQLVGNVIGRIGRI